MRILVTGATGFVGRWLCAELEAGGHEAVGAPGSGQLDITDADALAHLLRSVEPDAVAHLAAVAYAGDARTDPAYALRVNVGGTAALMQAVGSLRRHPLVLVTGSADAYGTPHADDLPLRETAPLRAVTPYGLTKLAQEAAAFELAARYDVPLVVTRSFNHIGPGQRPDFVVPALARRVARAAVGHATTIPIGNADVARDFLDVRDVVLAYRLLLELGASARREQPLVVNVASGTAVSIRWIAETMRAAAGCEPSLAVQQDLVREDDPPEIVGNADALRLLTGWEPAHDLEETLREILEDALALATAGRLAEK